MKTPAVTEVINNKKLYEDVAWGPLASVLVTVGAFFVAQIIGGILLLIFMLSVGGETIETIQNDSAVFTKTVYVFFGNMAVSLAMIWLVWVFLRSRKTGFKAIGLTRPKWAKDIPAALIGYGIYFAVFLMLNVVITAVVPELLEGEQALGFSKELAGLALLPVFISLVIMPPITEEILCRGFLFTGLRSKLSFIPATLITSLIFGAAHLNGGEPGVLLWIVAIDTLVLSFVLSYLRESTGRLWAPIMLHGLKNFVAFSVLYLV